MIESFVESWPLFWSSYLSGWAIGVLLSLIGVLVVIRDQIFVGAAVSQASTLGIALALWLGLGESEVGAAGMAVAFSIAAALFTGRSGRETTEARTGWVFLLASSLSILVLAHSPHGLEEIHRLLSSSIIGATPGEVGLFVALAGAVSVGLALAPRRILLVTTDPAMAEAIGMRVGWWSAGLAALMGLAVGLSIRSSGMLYTFGCLVLPALVAKNLCNELRAMFFVSPAVAVGTGVVAFVFANEFDYPPAQVAVALLAAALAAAWGLRAARSWI